MLGAGRYDVPGSPRVIGAAEEAVVQDTLQLFNQLVTYRNTTAMQWEEVAALIWPEMKNTFMYGSYNFPGQKKTQQQVDASGAMALMRFSAICDSLLTPRNMTWHTLSPSDPALLKSRRVRLWFEQATRALFRARYAPNANFAGQNHNNFMSLGAFGTNGMFIDAFDNPAGPVRGPRYKSVPLGELFIHENHQGLVDGFVRWFRLTALQTYQKWGKDRFPAQLSTALESNSQYQYGFLHRVCLRRDFDPQRMDAKGKPWTSVYVSLDGNCLMQPEGGYHTFPMSIGRYTQAPGEVYGRSPAMMVLPALKTLNAEKADFLTQGHRAVSPVLLTSDDGLVDGVSLRPGALNKGGWSADGHPLVGTLPIGDIQVSKEMMDEERGIIDDAFLVSLFQILTETPQMTATEVIERTNEKGILLAPTVGRQQSEYLGPMIERELDILARQRMLPPMPPELVEAKGEYETVYTSPLSRAMRAQEAAGFMRTVESVLAIVNATQDPSHLDEFDFSAATRGMAEIQAVPESWMADPKAVQAKQQARAKAQQQQQQVQALPAQAAMMKAQAVVAKGQPGSVGGPGVPPGPQQSQPQQIGMQQ